MIYDVYGNVIPTGGDAELKTYKRNSLSNVTEFLTVAQSYLGQTSIVYRDGITPMWQNNATNGIDCSTFVMFCLLGLPFSKSPYSTGVYGGPDALAANTEDYDWAMNPLKYSISRFSDGHNPGERVRLACQIGRWLYERGAEVSQDKGFIDALPGDLVFWGHKVEGTGAWYKPDWWRHINHIGIVLTKEDAPSTYVDGSGVTRNWDKTKYPYKHKIIEVAVNTPPCMDSNWLEMGQEDPTDVYHNNVNCIQMIARPDLGAI
jgi:hypothetical protein